MNKKPVEEIKMDSARNTIINQHKKFGKKNKLSIKMHQQYFPIKDNPYLISRN